LAELVAAGQAEVLPQVIAAGAGGGQNLRHPARLGLLAGAMVQ